MLRFFDTHCHLDLLPGAQLAAELDAARNAGIGAFLVPGVAPEGWPALSAVAGHCGVRTAPGLHPRYAERWDPALEQDLLRHMDAPGTVALGEIGLDALLRVAQTIQEDVFRAQLRLAVAVGLPVLLHCRKAGDRLLRIFDEEGATRVGGILHGYSGSPEFAAAALRRNLAIGFGGGLTWPEARRAPQVARWLPPESIVLESDAPDMTPHPHRGSVNRPCWLTLTAERLAQLRGWSLEETARITSANACRILRLPPLKDQNTIGCR